MRDIQATLLGLTIPLGAVAIALGAYSAVRAMLLVRKGAQLRRSQTAERVAMLVCAACATAAALMAFGGIQGRNYIVLAAALVQLAFAAAGVAFYFTVRRPLCESFAAIAMGIFSILTGFSVGAYIAPFAVAMGVLGRQHSREERRAGR